jgi:hypothetical protein
LVGILVRDETCLQVNKGRTFARVQVLNQLFLGFDASDILLIDLPAHHAQRDFADLFE